MTDDDNPMTGPSSGSKSGSTSGPVTEDELHAYVDGQLPDDRKEAVAGWLAANPDAAALVAAWRAQAESIRARYGSAVSEPVPERLQLDRIIAGDIITARHGGRPFKMMAAAAVLIAFVGGTATGWFARAGSHSETRPSGFDRITTQALDAYKLYVGEVRHPVEVPGAEAAHLRQWLSRRVGTELIIPDLSSLGLKLVGGRLLPGPNGAAAFYMYEGPGGERFTIYCSKATTEPEMALHFKQSDKSATFTWVEGSIGYVVSGPADRDRLETVAKNVYEQIDKGAAKKS